MKVTRAGDKDPESGIMAKRLGIPAVLEDLGEKITAARGKRLQVEIAKASGIDISTISDLENGRRNPSYTTLLSLAAALSVGLPDLLRGQAATGDVHPAALEKRVAALERQLLKVAKTAQDALALAPRPKVRRPQKKSR